MLTCQHHLFDLEDSVTYLNGAYMSPQLKSVTEIGEQLLKRKSRPYEIIVDDFFDPVARLKEHFAQLINAPEKDRIALIPSASYGLANAAANIDLKKGQNILMVEGQFPSNYYCWKKLVDRKEGLIRMVRAPKTADRGKDWNQAILDAIDEQTSVVALGHVHWADGTKYDLKSIRRRSREVGALLIIDGTQSVGALPFDVQEFEPDALICAGYKWLMGPYSLGVAYYGEYFDNGTPIEENWISRKDSEAFSGLVNYQEAYHPLAWRYSVGEHSNFNTVPMLDKAIEQLLEWTPTAIQAYCAQLWDHIQPALEELGCSIETRAYRGEHLVGVHLDDSFDRKKLREVFQKNRVYVSIRGNYIRVSPHVYNEKADMEVLVKCFKASKKRTTSARMI